MAEVFLSASLECLCSRANGQLFSQANECSCVIFQSPPRVVLEKREAAFLCRSLQVPPLTISFVKGSRRPLSASLPSHTQRQAWS